MLWSRKIYLDCHSLGHDMWINHFLSEAGGSMFLQNVGTSLPDYMVSQPRIHICLDLYCLYVCSVRYVDGLPV